jgi:Spy/CpxP family protein refolding chaperone
LAQALDVLAQKDNEMKQKKQHNIYTQAKELQMKALKTTMVIIVLTTMVFAQATQQYIPKQRFNDWGDVLNLTTEQQQQINALRGVHMGQSMTMMNQIKVLRAEITVLKANNGSREDILAKENLIIEKRAEMSKLHLEQREAVRALLTEEQKILFDENAPRSGMGNGAGHGNRNGGMGGQGRGMNGPMDGSGRRGGQGRW